MFYMTGINPSLEVESICNGVELNSDSFVNTPLPGVERESLRVYRSGLVSYSEIYDEKLCARIIPIIYGRGREFTVKSEKLFPSEENLDNYVKRFNQIILGFKHEDALNKPGQYARLDIFTDDGDEYGLEIHRDPAVFIASPILFPEYFQDERFKKNLAYLASIVCWRVDKEQFPSMTHKLESIKQEIEESITNNEAIRFVISHTPNEEFKVTAGFE